MKKNVFSALARVLCLSGTRMAAGAAMETAAIKVGADTMILTDNGSLQVSIPAKSVVVLSEAAR